MLGRLSALQYDVLDTEKEQPSAGSDRQDTGKEQKPCMLQFTALERLNNKEEHMDVPGKGK